jgi:hypothetical protein
MDVSETPKRTDDYLHQRLIVVLRAIIILARNPKPMVRGASHEQTTPPELQQIRDAVAVLKEAEERWLPPAPS